jgi:hypothetical protein
MIEIILLGYVLPLILMLLYSIYLDKDVKTVGDLFKYGVFIFIPILNWGGAIIITIDALIERVNTSVLWNRFLNIKFKKL